MATPDPAQQKSSTPTKPLDRGLDLTLSPIASPRTTMTSEELFAAIHRSKKRLNLKPETTPKPETNSAANAKTSLHNFKILLLQRGGKDSGKLSAVEQLRLSKDTKPVKEEPVLVQTPSKTGRRNQWRFASPRSDVLSSTILEDCNETESVKNRETERSQLLGCDRGGFDALKPPRVVALSHSPRRATESPKPVKSTGVGPQENRQSFPKADDAILQRSLPEPPAYIQSVGRTSPKRLISNTYAKITAPLQRTPPRSTETQRLIHSNSSSIVITPSHEKPLRKSVQDARKDFFSEKSPPNTVPYASHRFSPFPVEASGNVANGRAGIYSPANGNYSHVNVANGSALFASPTSALMSSSNETSARSPNVSLETAL